MTRKTQDRREWLIFTLILFLGVFMLQFAATIASTVPDAWIVHANIESDLDPDQEYTLKLLQELEPVKPEIMTPPAWDMRELLTPESQESGDSVIVPVVFFSQSPTPSPFSVLGVAQPVREGGDNPSQQGFVAENSSNPYLQATPTANSALILTATARSTISSQAAMATVTPTPTKTLLTTATKTPLQPPTETPTQPPPTKVLRPTKGPRPTRVPNPGKNK